MYQICRVYTKALCETQNRKFQSLRLNKLAAALGMMMIQNMKVEVDVENKEGLDKDYN